MSAATHVPGALRRCHVCGMLVVWGHDDARCETRIVHGALDPQIVTIPDREIAGRRGEPGALLDAAIHAHLTGGQDR